MKIEKANPAGWKVTISEEESKEFSGVYYFGEYGQFGPNLNNGCVYKDENAFKSGRGVCYIPELSFDSTVFNVEIKEKLAEHKDHLLGHPNAQSGYTRDDFISLCDGDIALAEELFEYSDWQCPESLLMDWDADLVIEREEKEE